VAKAITFDRFFDFMEMEGKDDKESMDLIKDANRKLESLADVVQLNTKETLDIFGRGINWFFAISVGTLLWILSNFDKFKVAGVSPMPYKNLYMLSIIFVGLSSIILANVLGRLYWSNFMTTIGFETYSRDLKNTLNNFKEYKNSPPKLGTVAKDVGRISATFEFYGENWMDMFQLITNKRIIKFAALAYAFGLLLISIYILFFMYDYL